MPLSWCCVKLLTAVVIISFWAGILKEFFEDFGEVTECSIMKDPVTKRSRYVHVLIEQVGFCTLVAC